MNILNNMNTKLTQGYKLTDMSCSKCNGVTMGKINLQQVYCPKCNQSYQIQQADINNKQQQEQGQQQDQYQQYYRQSQNNKAKVSPLGYNNARQKQQEDIYSDNINNKNNNDNNNINNNTIKANNNNDNDKDTVQQNYQQFLKLYNQKQKNRKSSSDQVSKKIGTRLIQGWRMLNQACQQCNVPLMQNKNGDQICCGCDKNYAVVKKQKKQNKSKLMPNSKKLSSIPQKVQDKIQDNETKKQNKYQKGTTNITATEDIDNKVASENKNCMERIKNKSLCYLQNKLEHAIQDNDLSQVQRIIQIIKKAAKIGSV